jgi:hypothetical protein
MCAYGCEESVDRKAKPRLVRPGHKTLSSNYIEIVAAVFDSLLSPRGGGYSAGRADLN